MSLNPAELRSAALQHAVDSGQRETVEFWKSVVLLQSKLHDSGGFWSDVVGKLKREERYMEAAIICRRALPVPAAYSQLLICLRNLYIRGADNRPLLKEIYRFAVEADVLYRVRIVELDTLQGKKMTPVFNVASIVYVWLQAGEFPVIYEKLGFNLVRSLKATDRKRLAAELGDPGVHQDPFEVARPLWEKGIAECAGRWTRMHQEAADGLKALLRNARSIAP